MPGPKPTECTVEMAMFLRGPVYVEQWKELVRCSFCKRPLRPHRAVLTDWPATVAQATAHVCKACYNKGHRDERDSGPHYGGMRDQGSLQKPVPRRETAAERRANAVASWSPERRGAALQVVHYVGDEGKSAVLETFEMLGLFDPPGSFGSSGLAGGLNITGS